MWIQLIATMRASNYLLEHQGKFTLEGEGN